MRVILNQDIIVNITERGDTEIGAIPKGVGLDRVRWDGTNIVDLMNVTEIWVTHQRDMFGLHVVQVPGSQLVSMSYADRKNLMIENGTIRLKTPTETEERDKEKRKAAIKNRLMRKLGDIDRRIENNNILIFALIVYARNQPQALKDYFDLLIPIITEIYPLDRVKNELKGILQNLKTDMKDYYQELDNIE